MKLKLILALLVSSVAWGQGCVNITPTTSPNIGLYVIATNACQWGTYTNDNMGFIDSFFSGGLGVPRLWFPTTTAPSNPANGLKLWVDVSDGQFHTLNSSGVNSVLGSGGGGYTLPIATTSVLGGIKPDNSSITVNPTTGVASAVGSGGPTGPATGALSGTYPAPSLSNIKSVYDYGAKCDGSTDDSIALAAAAASGFSIQLPKGNTYCLFSIPLVITNPMVWLGQGVVNSVLEYTGTSGIAMTWNTGQNQNTGTGLRNVTLYTPNQAGTTGILLGGSSGAYAFYCEHCVINGFGLGVTYGPNTWDTLFLHSTFINDLKDLLYPDGLSNSGENLQFLDTTFNGVTGSFTAACVDIEGPANAITFTGAFDSGCQLKLAAGAGVVHVANTHFEAGVAITAPFIDMGNATYTLLTLDNNDIAVFNAPTASAFVASIGGNVAAKNNFINNGTSTSIPFLAISGAANVYEESTMIAPGTTIPEIVLKSGSGFEYSDATRVTLATSQTLSNKTLSSVVQIGIGAAAISGIPLNITHPEGVAPFFSQITLTPSTANVDSFMNFESTRLSTTQDWTIGSGNGGSPGNNYFRIIDATTGNDALDIIPNTRVVQNKNASFTFDQSGNVNVVSLTDSSLTIGNCIQASTGGLLTTTSAPCGSGGGSSNISVGSGVPTANCTVGSGTFIYFDTALTNAGTAFYFCSATNIWSPWFALDGNLLLSYTGANGVPVISVNTAALCPLTSACTYTGALTGGGLQVHNGNLSANGTTPTAVITGSGCAGTLSGTNLSGTISMTGGGTCTVQIVPSTAANAHYLCPALQNRNQNIIAVQVSDGPSSALFATMAVTSGDVLQYGTCSAN